MSRRNTISREFFATIAAVLVLGLSVMCAIQAALSAAYFIGERKSSLTDVLNGATALSERFADEGSIVTKPLQGEDVLERAHSGFELFNTTSGALIFIADKNGNILSLQCYGQTSASVYGLITLTGNLLNRVDDTATTSAYNNGFEFKDGVKQANEYVYDANGNLTKDLNKGISNITYNVLNLPTGVTFASGGFIQYGYTADGIKRRMMYKEADGSGNPVPTVYCGNVVYENGVARLLLTEEGYVTLSDKKYHYYLQDHQGNNRVVLSSSGAVEEANHYYPFGGVFASSGNVQPYKYNGKEYDSKKGLNWYDYGARHYDAVLGRFTTNDRFAEKYYSMSPYQYGANSPVGNIDVNGDSIRICTETQSFGHTWISVGEGSNMTVYSYGRYNGTNKGPDRSSNSLGNGSGVLLKLMGDEAKAYNDKKSSWWNVCICSNRCGR